MNKIRPIYTNLLIAAIALYLIATAIMFSDLYVKVERMGHTLMHLTGGH